MSSALETLHRDFGGDIIEPGGAEYESARRSVLASGSPAYVLQPKSVADVQAGVRFGASAGLLLSVRGGGHGFAGFGDPGFANCCPASIAAEARVFEAMTRSRSGRPVHPRVHGDRE